MFYSSLQLCVSSLYPPAASRPFGKDQSIAIMMYSPVYVRIILSLQLGPQFAIWNHPSDVHYLMYVFFVSDVAEYVSWYWLCIIRQEIVRIALCYFNNYDISSEVRDKSLSDPHLIGFRCLKCNISNLYIHCVLYTHVSTATEKCGS